MLAGKSLLDVGVELSVKQNVDFFAKIYRLTDKTERGQPVEAVIREETKRTQR